MATNARGPLGPLDSRRVRLVSWILPAVEPFSALVAGACDLQCSRPAMSETPGLRGRLWKIVGGAEKAGLLVREGALDCFHIGFVGFGAPWRCSAELPRVGAALADRGRGGRGGPAGKPAPVQVGILESETSLRGYSG